MSQLIHRLGINRYLQSSSFIYGNQIQTQSTRAPSMRVLWCTKIINQNDMSLQVLHLHIYLLMFVLVVGRFVCVLYLFALVATRCFALGTQ